MCTVRHGAWLSLAPAVEVPWPHVVEERAGADAAGEEAAAVLGQALPDEEQVPRRVERGACRGRPQLFRLSDNGTKPNPTEPLVQTFP